MFAAGAGATVAPSPFGGYVGVLVLRVGSFLRLAPGKADYTENSADIFWSSFCDVVRTVHVVLVPL